MPAKKPETEIRYEEAGKSYMNPEVLLNPIKRDEEEPLSDKQIEALSYLIKANKPFNPMNWTMLFIGILCAILYFVYC